MKKIIAFLFLLAFGLTAGAQGKYAGAYKNLIGKKYTEAKNIARLKNWKYFEGCVLTEVNDPEMITVEVFQKADSRLIFFSVNEDTSGKEFTINDVLLVTPVPKGWAIKTAVCRDNKINNVWLIALARETTAETLNTIKKVWRINPDKRRIEAIGIQRIDCLNEGEEQY